MIWTDERYEEARQAAADYRTAGDLAEALSQRWGEYLTKKSVSNAFARRGESITEYLGLSRPFQASPSARASEPAQVAPGLAVVRAVQRGATTLEALCDALGQPPRAVRGMVAEARAAGYDINLGAESISFGTHKSERREPSTLVCTLDSKNTKADPAKFAAISDTHFGSRTAAIDDLQEFILYAYHEEGVRKFLHPGDMFEGCYHRGHQFEVAEAGFDNQARIALESLPELPGATYYFITGNHDWNSYYKACGMDPGRAFLDRAKCSGRSDFVHLGHLQGRVQFGEHDDAIRVELAHPDKGPAYAKSYPIQKWVEQYEGGDKPTILVMGHYHSYNVSDGRNVQGIYPGCWQFKTTFEKGKGLQPSVGGAIIWAWKDEYGLRFRHEFRKVWPRGVVWHVIKDAP